MNELLSFVRRLATEGGEIVSSARCSQYEIALAQACNRIWVDPETHCGYVLRRSEGPQVQVHTRRSVPLAGSSRPEMVPFEDLQR